MNPTLQAAVAAARAAALAAASVIRDAAADPGALQVRAKQPNDFVTQVDLASERVIVQTLLAAFPQHGVRSEESARLHGNAEADHVWIVDPLDGTNNFIHGYPAYAVSIALAVRGRVEVGVVLDVSSGALFQAALGGGAWCNGERLRVSDRATLDGALVSTSAPFRPGPGFEARMQMLGAVMAVAGAVRRSGSAAIDLARVAAGQCDASFDLGLNAWDVAARGLLVSEAGGEVSTFGGNADYLESKQCVAANPSLRRLLVSLLRPFDPSPLPPWAHPHGTVTDLA